MQVCGFFRAPSQMQQGPQESLTYSWDQYCEWNQSI